MMMDEDCDFKSLIDIFENEEELLGSDLSLGALDFQGVADKEPYQGNKRRRSRLSGLFGSNGDSEGSIKRRLRSASEIFKKGVLSMEEKKVITEKILSKDIRFAQEFDQAKETGNWDRLRQALHGPLTNSFSSRRSSLIMSALEEGGEEPLQEAFLSEDLSAVFDSSGIMSQKPPPKKKGRPRKYPPTQTKSKKDKVDSSKQSSKRMIKREKLAGSPIALKTKSGEAQGGSKVGLSKAQLSRLAKLETLPPKTLPGSGSNGASHGKKGSDTQIVSEIQDLQKHGRKVAREAAKAKGMLDKYASPSPSGKINKQFNKGRRMDAFNFESDKDAKFRKNERERRRRLMVSQGFSDLVTVLNLPETAKVDKATVLNNSIKKIQTLQRQVQDLEQEMKQLKSSKTTGAKA